MKNKKYQVFIALMLMTAGFAWSAPMDPNSISNTMWENHNVNVNAPKPAIDRTWDLPTPKAEEVLTVNSTNVSAKCGREALEAAKMGLAMKAKVLGYHSAQIRLNAATLRVKLFSKGTTASGQTSSFSDVGFLGNAEYLVKLTLDQSCSLNSVSINEVSAE